MSALRRAVERAIIQDKKHLHTPAAQVLKAVKPSIIEVLTSTPKGESNTQQLVVLRERFEDGVAQPTARFADVDEQMRRWPSHGTLWNHAAKLKSAQTDPPAASVTSSGSQATVSSCAGPSATHASSTGTASYGGSRSGSSDGCSTSGRDPANTILTNSAISKRGKPMLLTRAKPKAAPRKGRRRTASDGSSSNEDWTPALESDIHAVAVEAGLPAACADAMVEAARKGRVSSNPGVLLAQLLRLQSGLEGRMPKRVLVALLRTWPGLVAHQSDTVAWHWEELVDGWGEPEATAMVMRAPSLLTTPPFTVWSHLDDLAVGLDIDLEGARAVALKHPKLLTGCPDAVGERLQELTAILMMPAAQVQRLVTSQPSLLTYYPSTLDHNLTAMAACLGTSKARAARVVSRAPALLMLSQDTFAAKLEGLASLLGGDQLLAASVVLRQPTVMSISTDLLTQKLSAVGKALGTGQQHACQVVSSNPALLTLSLGTLERKVAALDAAVAAAVALAAAASAQPALEGKEGRDMSSDGSGAGSVCGSSGSGAHLAAAWAEQLAAASPSVRAALACFSDTRYARLSQLVAAHAQAAATATARAPSEGAGSTQQQQQLGPVKVGSKASSKGSGGSKAGAAGGGGSVSLSSLLRMSDAEFQSLMGTLL